MSPVKVYYTEVIGFGGKYADVDFVFEQAGFGEAGQTVVGGFHQDDCVNDFARELAKRGHKVVVDEDTTERFFKNYYFGRLLRNNIPVVRTSEEYARFFRDVLLLSGEVLEVKFKQDFASFTDKRVARKLFARAFANNSKVRDIKRSGRPFDVLITAIKRGEFREAYLEYERALRRDRPWFVPV